MGEYSPFSLNGKVYTREELIEIGREHYPKFYWISRGIGIGLMFIGILCALIFLISCSTVGFENITSYGYFITMGGFLLIALVGVFLFGLSFRKIPDDVCIDYAKAYLTRVNKQSEAIAKKEEKDNIEQLLNYKKLLDAGVITQEEFDKKKKELL